MPTGHHVGAPDCLGYIRDDKLPSYVGEDYNKQCFNGFRYQVQLSNEQNLRCLGFLGDDKLPSYVGIMR